VQEGRGDGVLLLVRSDNSEAARLRLATMGEAAVGVEQSNEEATVELWEGGVNMAMASCGDIRAQG
jgi:hypothetical protein